MPILTVPRAAALLALALSSAPACAGTSDDIPLSPIGMPFKPGTPQPVQPGHPLYHHVAVDPLADMPNVVGSSATAGFMGAAKRTSFEKALRETLEKLNMLAPSDADAKFRLTTHWQGMDAPFKISFSSHATARLSYSLARIDTGQQIFQRDIATSAEARGGDGSLRAIGVGRMALMANLASMAYCLDKAAYGAAPDDCALEPDFTYEPPRASIMIMYHYRR